MGLVESRRVRVPEKWAELCSHGRVLTQDEFAAAIDDDGDRVQFHRYILSTDGYPTVFLCDVETDEDRNDPDYRDNCDIDELCADYVHQYYVARLKAKRTATHVSIGDMLWDGVNGAWSYGFDVYKCHRLKPGHARRVLDDCGVCNIRERWRTYRSGHMSHDLTTLLRMFGALTRDRIEEAVVADLNERCRQNAIAEVNRRHDSIAAKSYDSRAVVRLRGVKPPTPTN